MKTLLLSLLLFFAISLRAATNTVTLAWNYPTSLVTTDLVFCVSYTTNLATPFAPLTNVAGPASSSFVGSNTYYTAQFVVVPGAYFFTCQTSNFWGVSATSNYAWTPPAPLALTNLAISRP